MIRRHDQPAQDLGQSFWVAAAQVLQHIGEAATRAETKNRRRRQWNHRPAFDLAELGAESRDQGRHAGRRVLALLERLERHHHEGGVGLRVVVDEIQTDDRGDVFDGRFLPQDGFGLGNDRLSPHH